MLRYFSWNFLDVYLTSPYRLKASVADTPNTPANREILVVYRPHGIIDYWKRTFPSKLLATVSRLRTKPAWEVSSLKRKCRNVSKRNWGSQLSNKWQTDSIFHQKFSSIVVLGFEELIWVFAIDPWVNNSTFPGKFLRRFLLSFTVWRRLHRQNRNLLDVRLAAIERIRWVWGTGW